MKITNITFLVYLVAAFFAAAAASVAAVRTGEIVSCSG